MFLCISSFTCIQCLNIITVVKMKIMMRDNYIKWDDNFLFICSWKSYMEWKDMGKDIGIIFILHFRFRQSIRQLTPENNRKNNFLTIKVTIRIWECWK